MNTIPLFDINGICNVVDLASQLPVLDPEIWGKYDERYEVSTHGRVYDLKLQRPQVFHRASKGYHSFKRYSNGTKKTLYPHRMVLQTFATNPNPEKYPFVDHINRDKTDNRLCNLRWSNYSLNVKNTNARGYCKNGKKWRVKLLHQGTHIAIGSYATTNEARQAYLEAKERSYDIESYDL